MPGTPTIKLSLYKSASDGSELVNYTQDVGNNLDKIDSAMGFTICTSSTRPSVPYVGQAIYEGDTHRMYVWTSGTWTEIAVPLATPIFTAGIGATGASSTTNTMATYVAGDSANRMAVRADGQITWGPGNAALDTNLYRSAANTLKTDDSLVVAGSATVTGNVTGANLQVVLPWTNLASLGTFQTNFSANATQIPRFQKVINCGTPEWWFEGTINASAFAAATVLNMFIFTSSSNFPTNERGFSSYGSSSNFYPIRVGLTGAGILQGGVPTAAGTSTNRISLDGFRITNP